MSGALKKRVYSHIYKKLCNGELGPGERISGRSLAKEIGVSPIPVRDAISQLSSEGFLKTVQGGGAYVPEPNSEEIKEIYDQREALECHAVVRAAESCSSDDLAELENCIKEMADVTVLLDECDPAERDAKLLERWSQADANFHDTIMRAAGNQRSLETIINLRVTTRIYGKIIRYEPIDSMRDSKEHHQRILDAIRNKDANEASLAMAEHIRNGCRLILRSYNLNRMRSGED